MCFSLLQINHLAHHFLTTLLQDKLTRGGRVVVVSSSAEGVSYEEGIAFSQWTNDNGYDDGKACKSASDTRARAQTQKS